ncbi:MAG: YdhR family protein [Candidatus Limnocylindria bacterium]
MHVQIVNFKLKGISLADYDALCEQVAPSFAGLPGLVSKVWLTDDATNTYGGVYTWRDREAMEAFLKSDLFRAVATHPNLAEMTSRDFAVQERFTAITSATRPVAVAA